MLFLVDLSDWVDIWFLRWSGEELTRDIYVESSAHDSLCSINRLQLIFLLSS